MKRRTLFSMTFALALAIMVTTSAFAHVCTNPNKQAGAGSVASYNVMTGEFVPGPHFNGNLEHLNGGFITLHDGGTWSYDVFIHQTLPEGALDAGPGEDNYCDGKGVDFFLACIGATGE